MRRYAEGADEFRQYHGELPYGLNFTLARREVERAIGLGTVGGGSEYVNVYSSYAAKKVSVTYDTKSKTDMAAHISVVCLTRDP